MLTFTSRYSMYVRACMCVLKYLSSNFDMILFYVPLCMYISVLSG